MIRQIKETCLYVSDLDEAERFYKDILGLELIGKKEGRHVFFRIGDDVLLLFIPEVTREDTHLPPHYASGKQHIAFEVSVNDYEEVKEDLWQKGVVITHEEDWGAGILSFYFEDPDGNVLEIVSEGLWEY